MNHLDMPPKIPLETQKNSYFFFFFLIIFSMGNRISVSVSKVIGDVSHRGFFFGWFVLLWTTSHCDGWFLNVSSVYVLFDTTKWNILTSIIDFKKKKKILDCFFFIKNSEATMAHTQIFYLDICTMINGRRGVCIS